MNALLKYFEPVSLFNINSTTFVTHKWACWIDIALGVILSIGSILGGLSLHASNPALAVVIIFTGSFIGGGLSTVAFLKLDFINSLQPFSNFSTKIINFFKPKPKL